jgi:hypothetical protein
MQPVSPFICVYFTSTVSFILHTAISAFLIQVLL